MALEPLYCVLSPLWAVTNTVARLVFSRSAKALPAPVISVGNIVAGGVGKTEIAAAIAARALIQRKRAVVASRGYGSKWENDGGVSFDSAMAASLNFPDESILILSKVAGVSVAVGANRLAVLTRHWEELAPDVVILDDGFQHFSIARDLDILVHDFSQSWPILRELPWMFRKADVRISFSEIPPYWKKLSKKYPWVRAQYHLKSIVNGTGVETHLPSRALAFCGLGNPKRFSAALKRAGVDVQGFRAFADHAIYTQKEARELVAWQKMNRGIPLLTTLKDYVKLKPLVESAGGLWGFEPFWVKLEVQFLENEQYLWKAVDETLAISRA